MAKHLARIHGTEEDKVNCPFYFKIGACRHADRCSRLHHRPAFSPTILIKHIYRHPVREAELRAAVEGGVGGSDWGRNKSGEVEVDKEKAMEDFLVFFENMYEELGKFGRIEALHVCDNLGDHMIGHVYAKFSDEEEASDALNVMNGRYYDGRKMSVEFSPVTDFREARCRDFDEDTCSRGGFCNFMHIKPVPMCLIRSLEEDCEEERRRESVRRMDREYRERERESRRKRKRRDRDGGSSSSSHRDRDRDSRKRDRRRGSDRDSERRREEDGGDGSGGGGGGSAGDGGSGDVGGKRGRSYSRSVSRSRSASPSGRRGGSGGANESR